MSTLLLMRHAKSDWSDGARDDHDRPLNDRGKRDASRMGRWLTAQSSLPTAIVTSSPTVSVTLSSGQMLRCNTNGASIDSRPQNHTFGKLKKSRQKNFERPMQRALHKTPRSKLPGCLELEG